MRIICPATEGKQNDKQHMVNVKDGKTLFHYAIPGQTLECPGSRQKVN